MAVNLSLIFTEIPLLARFDAAVALGFKGVEIQFPYEESPGDESYSSFDWLRRQPFSDYA